MNMNITMNTNMSMSMNITTTMNIITIITTMLMKYSQAGARKLQENIQKKKLQTYSMPFPILKNMVLFSVQKALFLLLTVHGYTTTLSPKNQMSAQVRQTIQEGSALSAQSSMNQSLKSSLNLLDWSESNAKKTYPSLSLFRIP